MRADEISANVIVALDGLGDFTSNRSTPREGGGGGGGAKFEQKFKLASIYYKRKCIK